MCLAVVVPAADGADDGVAGADGGHCSAPVGAAAGCGNECDVVAVVVVAGDRADRNRSLFADCANKGWWLGWQSRAGAVIEALKMVK